MFWPERRAVRAVVLLGVVDDPEDHVLGDRQRRASGVRGVVHVDVVREEQHRRRPTREVGVVGRLRAGVGTLGAGVERQVGVAGLVVAVEVLERRAQVERGLLAEHGHAELHAALELVELELGAAREARAVRQLAEAVGRHLGEVLRQPARVDRGLADLDRRGQVEGEALRVRRERAEVRGSAGHERVEHRVDVGVRHGRARRRADRAVEDLVDRQVVREAEEAREIVAAPEPERRGRRTEVAQRRAAHEVRPDRLVLQRGGGLGDLEPQPDDRTAVGDRRRVVEVRRVLAVRALAEQHRAVGPVAADVDERQRHLRVDPEHGVAHDAVAVAGRVRVGRRLVEVGALRVRHVGEVEDAAERDAQLRARQALELLVDAGVGVIALVLVVVGVGQADVGDRDRRADRQRRREHDLIGVVQEVPAAARHRAGAAGRRQRRAGADRAVDRRDVDGADLCLAREVNRGQRAVGGRVDVGLLRAGGRVGRAGLDVARLGPGHDEEVVVLSELAGRIGDVGQGVDVRLVEARPGELELGQAVEHAADLEALLVGLDRVLVAGTLLGRVGRAVGQADPRRLEVVELAVAQLDVGERAAAGEVDHHVGLDGVLGLGRELAAVLVVDDVDRQRDAQVLVDRVREVELVVEAHEVARTGLLQRAVVVRRGQEDRDERVGRAVRDGLRDAVALAVRVVVQDRAVELDRLRELGALVERVERVLEVGDAHAERVQLVLERVDELLELVEIGFRGIARAVGLKLRDDACDEHRHLVARQRAVALELTVGIPLDQTVGRERLDCLIGPVVRRHVRKRCGRDALTQRQQRAQTEVAARTRVARRFIVSSEKDAACWSVRGAACSPDRARYPCYPRPQRRKEPIAVPTATGTTTTRSIRNACRVRYTEVALRTPPLIKNP